MNEFTKEELEELAHNLGEIRAWSDSLTNSWPLLDKIQSMIDNYCQHEKMEFDGDVYGYSCKKCEKQFTGQVVDADRHYNIICGHE